MLTKDQPTLVPTLNLLVTYDYYERVFLWITKSNLMITLFAVLSILFYLVAAFMLTGKFFHQQGPNQRAAMIVACLAVGAHIIYLQDVIFLAPGQNMSIANVLSLVSCLTTLAMLISSRFLPNLVLLPAVFGFSALSVSAALFIPSSHIMHIAVQSGLLVHITLSLFAYGTITMASLYALQMSYITYRLKQKGAMLLHSSLPPLTLVETTLLRLIVIGTGLLVVSLISGFIFLDDMFSKNYAHKTVLSLIALVVFLVLIVGQSKRGWRGRQVVTLTLTGFGLLTLAYFGSRLVREIIL